MVEILRSALWGFVIGFLLAMLGIVDVHGQDRKPVCQDVIGLLHRRFPAKLLGGLAPMQFCGSHLDWTFSENTRNLAILLRTGKVTSWQIDFFNGPGLRNGQLGAYEPHYGETVASFNHTWERGGGKYREHLRDRVQLYCALFANFPDIELEMSPTLEHNLSPRAFRYQARVVKKYCPRAVVVENPVGGVRSSGGRFKIERHGSNVRGLLPPCSVSLDGSDAFDVDVLSFLDKRNQECRKYLWSHPWNLRLKKGTFQDPRARPHAPTRSIIREMFILGSYRVPLIAFPGCTQVRAPRLWKPLADDHGIGDVRANKPLYLTPYRTDEIEVRATNGVTIAKLKYYGPFDGGGYRYYSGTGSNLTPSQLADLAIISSGSPLVALKEGRSCYGYFHPVFRQGTFRD